MKDFGARLPPNHFGFWGGGIEHLLFSCNKSGLFGRDFHSSVVTNNLNVTALIYRNIKSGFILEDRKLEFLF